MRIVYHSCRNRHCPNCQHMPRERWLEKRKQEILKTAYFHLHCLVAGGALCANSACWRPCKNDYLFNARAMSLVFRGKFMADMKMACQRGDLETTDNEFNQLKY